MEKQIGPDDEAIPNAGDGVTDSALAEGAEDDGAAAGTKFDPKQRLLLAALVNDPDVRTAAESAGVSRNTAHRWLRTLAFKEELARRRDAVLSAALAGIQTQAERAAVELGRLLGTEDGRLRRLVCNDILNHAIRLREAEEFERRVSALEAALGQLGKEEKK